MDAFEFALILSQVWLMVAMRNNQAISLFFSAMWVIAGIFVRIFK